MVVYVLNCEGKPLMPCSPRSARKLLNSGKVKVVSKTPFTVQNVYPCADRIQEVVAGMDTGSKTIGIAAISNGTVLFQGETILRGREIKRKMEQRAMYRRTRRSRLRYRKPRFLNRRASTRLNRLPPSVKHKVESHLREKKFLESILPISKWFVETASFDIHKISDPTVSKKNGKSYQQGPKYDLGFYNTKSFILARDKYTCQKCKAKGTDRKTVKLHVHHIIFRSNKGTDTPNNLVTLCESCHNKLHLLKSGKAEKESLKLQKAAQKSTKHATEVSILKSRLLKSDWKFEETFGYITKFNRETQGLLKTHANDAIVIASQGEILSSSLSNYLVRRLVSKGDYQQTKGIRSEKSIPTGKICGYRRFDKVNWNNISGFIKGRMSSGYAVLMDVFGNKIEVKPMTKLKSENLIRIASRKLILTQTTSLL